MGIDIEASRYDVEIKAIAPRFFSVSGVVCLCRFPSSMFPCARVNPPVFWRASASERGEALGHTGTGFNEKHAAAIVAEGTELELTCRDLISGFGSGDEDANS